VLATTAGGYTPENEKRKTKKKICDDVKGREGG
jgi:hypothetical protein